MEAPIPPPIANHVGIPLPTPGNRPSRAPRTSSSSFRSMRSGSSPLAPRAGARTNVGGMARRSVGIFLLMMTVFLWTASTFLASNIFADDTFSKPFFVTYINTTFFAVALIPVVLKLGLQKGYRNLFTQLAADCRGQRSKYQALAGDDDNNLPKPTDEEERDGDAGSSNLESQTLNGNTRGDRWARRVVLQQADAPLSYWETIKLSFEFCILWFVANYFAAACLKYTSVASSTILNSTSSVWTLLFGAFIQVERFSVKKLIGVIASMAGVILISSVDLSGSNDQNRGNFPHKTQTQVAIGDAMAFFGALVYGFYTILMKKRIGNEGRVNMPLFFGLVGLMNVVLLWPGFIILHFIGEETFELPPSRKVWAVVLLNSTTSLISDVCWAYAMLLTSPLVVTVGLSLTIPLSLVGQMIIQGQYSSAAYWVGACIVCLSFVFINHESKGEEESEVGAEDFPPDEDISDDGT
ncbi:MAG: hypothetical protein M1829_000682 [Trizodia sp. TS-e1964]|nr:MAG: hypothetical protein M1829_000682 [Trizodia sp. TS-e1964]